MSLFEKYFKKREKLFEQIRVFESKHDLFLIKRLQNETDVQFLSTITEIHFGLFFEQFSSEVKYEKNIANKTPDWLFRMNEQSIIAEVVRLNPSASDKEELDFDSNLIDTITLIKIGCVVYFKYKERMVDRASINLLECKKLLEHWLSETRHPYESILLFNSIKFEFIKYTDSVDHVCLYGGGGSIKFDYRRLNSEKSTLVLKAIKYTSLIEEFKLPYIICLYLDFHTWFDKEDLYKSLYGSSSEHFEEDIFCSHKIEDALYYSQKQLMKNVSGILLLQKDEYTYFHNFSNNKLNDINKNILLNWQHPYM